MTDTGQTATTAAVLDVLADRGFDPETDPRGRWFDLGNGDPSYATGRKVRVDLDGIDTVVRLMTGNDVQIWSATFSDNSPLAAVEATIDTAIAQLA